MRPKQIKIINKEYIYIKWQDEKQIRISLKYLRDQCPCANCKGETVLLKNYRPTKLNIPNTDMYEVNSIVPVGNYGLQFSWKDGHSTGIYSWEYLQKLAIDQKDNLEQKYSSLL